MADKKNLIILTAGGTGGHIYPAEALATQLSDKGYKLIFITDKRGLNNYHGTLSKIKNISVLSGPLMGKSKLLKIKSLFKLAIGLVQSLSILLWYRPKCIVGFGGYASFPCCVAAILLKRKLIIHEQNSVMSRTNRFLARYATAIAASFPKTKYLPANKKTIQTGMPVRKTISKLFDQKYQSPDLHSQFNILVLGGSQGAKIFSETVPNAIKSLSNEQQKRLDITQQCRADDVSTLQQEYQDLPCKVTISSFFDNMPEIYAQTHLVISRSGASSVSEIAAAGLPAIFVPLPTAADDHQTTNATAFGDCDGCIVVQQEDFTPKKLTEILVYMLNNPQYMQSLSNNIKKVAITDADARLADVVEQIITGA